MDHNYIYSTAFPFCIAENKSCLDMGRKLEEDDELNAQVAQNDYVPTLVAFTVQSG